MAGEPFRRFQYRQQAEVLALFVLVAAVLGCDNRVGKGVLEQREHGLILTWRAGRRARHAHIGCCWGSWGTCGRLAPDF
jgi:hypothetical protein